MNVLPAATGVAATVNVNKHELGGLIKKGQLGVQIPSTQNNKFDTNTLPWSKALEQYFEKPQTTNEMFDPEIKKLYGMKDKIKTYADRLISEGYSPEQTYGILGNIYQESKFNPLAKQPNGKGEGLIQWTRGDLRHHKLASYASSRGLPITNEGVQFDHLVTELNAPDRQYIENA